MTQVTLRVASLDDADECGRICFDAFQSVALSHGASPEFKDRAEALDVMRYMLSQPTRYRSTVADLDGRIVGSNFVDTGAEICGVGPLTVDPRQQNNGVGRLLITDAIRHFESSGAQGIRLVQAAYHVRSLSLYTKLGFNPRETLACMQHGANQPLTPNDLAVRAKIDDVDACNALCRQVHGHDREAELLQAISAGTALIAKRNGRIVAYTTGLSFFGHSIAECNDDLKQLLLTADRYGGPGILVPIANSELFRWCLEVGMHVVQLETMLSMGFYQTPAGAFLRSEMW